MVCNDFLVQKAFSSLGERNYCWFRSDAAAPLGGGLLSSEVDDHFLGVVNFQDQVHLTEPAHKLLQLHSQRSVSEEEEQTAGHQGADS